MQNNHSNFLYTGNTCLYSPYILTPDYTSVDSIREHLRKSFTMQDVCEHLMYPQDVNLKDDFYKAYISYLRYILSEFIRNFDDKKYPDFKMPRHWDKKFKDSIKSQSNLLGKLWELIRLLSHHFYGASLPLIFLQIVKEHDLVLFDCRRTEANENKTVRSFKDIIQKQNNSLTNYDYSEEFTFSEKRSPATVGFLKICRIEAGRNNSFRSQYLDFVKARKSLTTDIFKLHPNTYKQGSNKKIERRGRKY